MAAAAAAATDAPDAHAAMDHHAPNADAATPATAAVSMCTDAAPCTPSGHDSSWQCIKPAPSASAHGCGCTTTGEAAYNIVAGVLAHESPWQLDALLTLCGVRLHMLVALNTRKLRHVHAGSWHGQHTHRP